MPNLKYVSVMMNWFSTSLNSGEARIVLKVESNDKAIDWQMGEYW